MPDRFADGRHGTILKGLERAGWRIAHGPGSPRDERDLLVTWTVHRGHKERTARAFEAAGGRVLVCEEAYIREVNGERHLALALHDHNGAGRWNTGGPERWEAFAIDLKPWRRNGRHMVVREQRGIGSERMASPPLWHDGAAARLRALAPGRAVKVRFHPKSRLFPEQGRSQLPLADFLDGAHGFVTWASADGVSALIAGVPVFFEAPHWICQGAASRGLGGIEAPPLPDRLPALERLAWAQWSMGEIEHGEPFRFLLAD